MHAKITSIAIFNFINGLVHFSNFNCHINLLNELL